jgi:hypothetical protein
VTGARRIDVKTGVESASFRRRIDVVVGSQGA